MLQGGLYLAGGAGQSQRVRVRDGRTLGARHGGAGDRGGAVPGLATRESQ